MRILLTPIGSAGEVFPYLGIGVELKRRGHSVLVLTSSFFESQVRRLGLEFHALEAGRDYEAIVSDPALWDSRRSFEFMVRRFLLAAIPEVYRFIIQRHTNDAIVVAPPVALGARLAQEKGIPTVTLILQPFALRTIYDTPRLPGLEFLAAIPSWMKPLFYRLIDWQLDRILLPGLNAFRTEIGLPSVRRPFNGWWLSPNCNIGLFPEWYGEPQPDWPSQLRLVGFPVYDSLGDKRLPEKLEDFLKAGEPPLIFTGGTAMKQGSWFFEPSLQASLQLGCRAVLVNKFREAIPEKLPPTVFYCDFAPFSLLFPRGKMIIHPGGIGTTSQALAAGVPQLIVPLVNDQFDQAARIKRLGAGGVMKRVDFQAAPLAQEIQNILATPEIAQRARELSQRVDGPRSVTIACDLIEKAGLKQ